MAERLRADDGVTLIEMLVVMTMLSVVMALITGSTIVLQRSINETSQRYDDLSRARVAMDATTKLLRSAITVDRDETAAVDQSPFRVGRRGRVDFLSNVDVTTGSGAPKRVQLTVVNGDELRERVWDGTINAAGLWEQSGGARTRIVARGVTATWLFTFFDEDGNEIESDEDEAAASKDEDAVEGSLDDADGADDSDADDSTDADTDTDTDADTGAEGDEETDAEAPVDHQLMKAIEEALRLLGGSRS